MNLPNALLEEARARAAAEHTTVTSLVIEGLRARLASPTGGRGVASLPLPSQDLGRALVDISDNVAVREALESEHAATDDRP